MAFTKNNTQATNNEKINYNCKVDTARLHVTEDGREIIYFDMTVNGVAISDCSMFEYTNKQSETGTMLSFPSRKYTNKQGETKYRNYAWFPVSKECLTDIRAQCEKIINEL